MMSMSSPVHLGMMKVTSQKKMAGCFVVTAGTRRDLGGNLISAMEHLRDWEGRDKDCGQPSEKSSHNPDYLSASWAPSAHFQTSPLVLGYCPP